jgi:hypothetical protein
MKYYSFIMLALILFIAKCQTQKDNKNEIIAGIDDKKITLKEFRSFYELDPNFGIDSTGLSALEDELYYYIYQILALRKANKNGLAADIFFVRASNWEQRQAILRELFRQDVQNQVQVSEGELRNAYENENLSVHVRHIFSKSQEETKNYVQRLKSGESFDTIARETFKDSTLAASGGDLGWIKLGDLDDNFAEGIKNLKGNEISDIVKTKWGFHIIQVLDYKKQLIVNESDFERRKPALMKKIQRQKSLAISNNYVRSIMLDLNPQPDPKIFRILWRTIVPLQEQERALLSKKYTISNKAIQECRSQYRSSLNAPFILYKNGKITLSEFLEKMESIPVSHRPNFKSARDLSDQIAVWIRDEFLYKRGLERKLNDHPTVIKEVERFKEEQSYNYLLNNEIAKLDVPDSVRRYFDTKPKGFNKLYTYHTLQQWQWEKASKLLNTYLKGFSNNIYINHALLQQESNRINWDKRIRMFMIRKPE